MKFLESKAGHIGVLMYQPGRRPHPAGLSHAATGVCVVGEHVGEHGTVVQLEHRRWGRAELAQANDIPPPPADILAFCSGVSKHDYDTIAACDSTLAIHCEAKSGNVLEDRKRMLRFAGAVMGDSAAAVFDTAASRFWLRPELDEELSHDAPLDVSSLMTIHAVREDGEPERIAWVHTHGLAELGAFDLDILAPHPDFSNSQSEIIRSLAFGVLEGELLPDTEGVRVWTAGGPADFVPVREFNRTASARSAAFRSMDESHTDNRSVLCEPRRAIDRFLRRGRRPAKAFQQSQIADPTVYFSNNATDLMSERARLTASVLRRVMEEFRSLKLMSLVKLGFATTGQGAAAEREHLWFEVKALHDDAVEGKLLNQPDAVPGLKEGDQGVYPLGWMSDWIVGTPVGMITPRDTLAARIIRSSPEIRKVLEDAANSQGQE